MTATANELVNDTKDREIIISRIINAPRELVFAAWTDQQHIGQWWGPKGFTNTVHEMDVRPGGKWLFTMHGPDGTDYPNVIIYDEVIKPERLAYRHGSGQENDPHDFRVVVTFDAVGDKTALTLCAVFATAEARNFAIREIGAIEGGSQTLSKLEEFITKKPVEFTPELILTRTLDAPRELVFDVWTMPEHFAKWWGPKGFDLHVTKCEVRPGGEFLYSQKGGDMEMWGKFIYMEIAAPAKLVFSSSFSDPDGNITRAPFNAQWPLEILNTLTLKEENEKTELTLAGGPHNATEEEMKAFRDWMGAMQQGFDGTFEKLDKYLAELQRK